ncbi:MAG: hypothetical protein SF051_12700 [Elusimicrobiota bacterium]|nr:hypothetical protein [Elusimicrobiota bacterium]
MRPLALVASLLAPVLASAQTAPAPLFTVVSRRVIYPASFIPVTPRQAQEAPMTLILEEGSDWQRHGMLERVMGKASAIFAQCGVSIGEVDALVVRWSPEALRRLNIENPYAGPAQMAVMDEPQIPALRPLGFLFAEGKIPSTASAYNGNSVRQYARQFPQAVRLLNTFWITSGQETRPRRRDELPSYSVTAHELAHLWGDMGHVPVRPNLMSDFEDPGSKSGDLTAEQCVEIAKLHLLRAP